MSEQIDYNKIHSLTIFKDLDRNELEKLQRFIFIKNTAKDSFLFCIVNRSSFTDNSNLDITRIIRFILNSIFHITRQNHNLVIR